MQFERLSAQMSLQLIKILHQIVICKRIFDFTYKISPQLNEDQGL